MALHVTPLCRLARWPEAQSVGDVRVTAYLCRRAQMLRAFASVAIACDPVGHVVALSEAFRARPALVDADRLRVDDGVRRAALACSRACVYAPNAARRMVARVAGRERCTQRGTVFRGDESHHRRGGSSVALSRACARVARRSGVLAQRRRRARCGACERWWRQLVWRSCSNRGAWDLTERST